MPVARKNYEASELSSIMPRIFAESTVSTIAIQGFEELENLISKRMNLLEVALGRMNPMDFLALEAKKVKKAVTKSATGP